MTILNEQEMQRVHDALVEAAWATPPRADEAALGALQAHFDATDWAEPSGLGGISCSSTLNDLERLMGDQKLRHFMTDHEVLTFLADGDVLTVYRGQTAERRRLAGFMVWQVQMI